MTDEENLILRAQGGDRDALETIVQRYWQHIYRLVYYKLGNADDAQEMAQETFLKTFAALPRYQRQDASFKTYISRIALNLVNDHWRKLGRRPQIVALEEHREPIEDLGEKPEEALMNAEQRRLALALVQKLPDDQRQVIQLRIIAGLSVKDAAAVMKRSEAALKMLQQRALRNLKKYFDELEKEQERR